MSREITVTNKANLMNENEMTFEQRKAELDARDKKEKEKFKRKRNSPFSSFTQINKATYDLEDKLMKKSPLAYRVWRFLVNEMDNYNGVIVSYAVLMEYFDSSRSTLYRAITLLEEGNYLKIFKSGTSNVYCLNDGMVWNSFGTNLPYSKFSAKVLVSEDEQTDGVKKKIKRERQKSLTLK